MPGNLLPVTEAQARLLAVAPQLPLETAPLAEAVGRWLAAPIDAQRTQPPVALSAMDGYAIRFAELPGPWTVVGESAAGRPLAQTLAPGEAARIFTGAALPAGADTILVQEEAARDGDTLRLAGEGPHTLGSSVRSAGSDFAAGTRLAHAGERLTPARVALAAMAGLGAVPVRRRLRIAIVSTGDELVPPGAPVTDATLPASNGVMLAAMLASLPCTVVDHGIVPDQLDALTAAFAVAAADADVVVTSGGVSVGDHDLVRPALAAGGATLDFWRVAMRPGKPLMAGRLADATVLGLPGNPVSAFVTAHLFLLPLVRHLAGDPTPLPPMAEARLACDLPAAGGRTDFLRTAVADGIAYPLASKDSAKLVELGAADALLVRPAGSAAARAGDPCTLLPLA